MNATPAPSSAPPRPGRGRRWLFRLIVVAGLAGAIEAGAYFSFWALEGQPYSFSRVARERRHAGRPAAPEVGAPRAQGNPFLTVHPYLGFSYTPEAGESPIENPVSDWGITDAHRRPPVRKRGPGKVVVGVVGGSVASMFTVTGVAALERELRQSPAFSGKQIEFVNLAVGLFKQPQQLMALNYALALGCELDVLINIDGLNDVAWYKHENAGSGVYHLFPLQWHNFVSDLPDPARRRLVGKVAYLQERRADWAASFPPRLLRHSVTANLIWKLHDRALHAEAARAEEALHHYRQEGLPFRARGPGSTFGSDREMLDQLVENWERCSLLLDCLCRAHGIRYYHFLQPNQYVPGSKPLSAAERKFAFLESLPSRPQIEAGYPLLREAGARLRRRGVRFWDLSMVFAGQGETFYFDPCCHFNRAGNEALASAVARALAETPEPPVAAAQAPRVEAPRAPKTPPGL